MYMHVQLEIMIELKLTCIVVLNHLLSCKIELVFVYHLLYKMILEELRFIPVTIPAASNCTC